MVIIRTILFLVMLLSVHVCFAQQADSDAAKRLKAALSAKRPIPALDSIWTEEMTWMEIRDAMSAGLCFFRWRRWLQV